MPYAWCLVPEGATITILTTTQAWKTIRNNHFHFQIKTQHSNNKMLE